MPLRYVSPLSRLVEDDPKHLRNTYIKQEGNIRTCVAIVVSWWKTSDPDSPPENKCLYLLHFISDAWKPPSTKEICRHPYAFYNISSFEFFYIFLVYLKIIIKRLRILELVLVLEKNKRKKMFFRKKDKNEKS